MSHKLKRSLSFLLVLALAFSLCTVPALATVGAEFATYAEIVSRAAVVVTGDDVATNALIGYTPLTTTSVASASLATGGYFSASGASGLRLEGSNASNGIAVQMASATDVFKIGGDTGYYDVDADGNITNGNTYNSVITAKAGPYLNYGEAEFGTAVAINRGELWIENSYIKTEDARSTPIYAFANSNTDNGTSVVVVDSHLETHSDEIWMPAFKLLYGGARATLLMSRNNSWFYGAEIVANTWGAISQDSIDANTYVINTVTKTTEGGYGSYQTYNINFYGSEMYSAQYGVFMCGTSHILTDTGAAGAADTAMMSKVPDYDVDEDASSIVVAPMNAVVVHTSVPGNAQVARGDFNNSVLSTLEEDLPDDVATMSYMDDYLYPGIAPGVDACGQTYFFTRNLYGSAVLIRSMNSDFTFDNTEVRSSNNVLLHSVITYDPPGDGQIIVTNSNVTSQAGNTATFKNGTYTGNILNEDYQRKMFVTVASDATLEGKAISGTKASWEAKWDEANLEASLAEDGLTADNLTAGWADRVKSQLILSGSNYFNGGDGYGIHMTVEDGGEWTVAETSSLASLTVEAGGTLSVPAGYKLTIYEGCDASSSNLFYDYSNATEVVSLTAGTTYENVVIVVEWDENAVVTADVDSDDIAYTLNGTDYLIAGETAQINVYLNNTRINSNNNFSISYSAGSSGGGGGGGGGNPMGGGGSAVSVSADGVITASSAGSATITVTVKDASGESTIGTATIPVTVALPTAVTVAGGTALVTDPSAISFAGGSGGFSQNGIDGALIKYNGVYTQGVSVSGTGSGGAFTIGGSGKYYDVDDSGASPAAKTGSTYNSVIIIDDGGNDEWNGEATYGSAIINTSKGYTLAVENAYVWLSGYGRPAIYSNGAAATVIRDSYIESAGNETSFMPSHRLLSGSARTNLALGGTNVWYYNSTVISPDWGALSTDAGGTTYLYAYNVTAESKGGGYGTYADNGCNVYLYATDIYSAEFGIFGCGNGTITVDSGANASSTALSMAGSSDTTAADGKDSYIYGTRNAMLVHTVGSGGQSGALEGGKTTYSTLSISNSTLTTTGTDENGKSLADIYVTNGDYDSVTNSDDGVSGAFINHHFGTTVLFRGGNADVELEDVEMASSNGILVQSVVNYDSMGAIYGKDDPTWVLYGIDVSMKDMDIEGDILHEDYQRTMDLDLVNTNVTGKIVSGTQAAWNAVWANESDAVKEALVTDTNMRDDKGYYETVWGLNLTVDGDSVWTVTETSSLASLKIEDGTMIMAPDGYSLTIYIDCDMSNENLFYDYTAGTEVSALNAGQTYEGVVIVVTKDVPIISYNVTYNSNGGAGASYSASVTSGAAHAVLAVTDSSLGFTKEGYDFAGWNTAANGTGTGYAAGDTFSVNGNMTLYAQWTEIEEETLPFTDVDEGEWYYDAVSYTYHKGLLIGTSDTTFEPKLTLTREMFVTVLARLAESMGEDVSGYTQKFSDVQTGKWYSSAIAWAASKGIVKGYSSTTFGLGDAVSREQIAALFVRFADYMDITLGSDINISFKDASDISDWAVDEVAMAAKAGLFQGDENGYFHPLNGTTRAEAAQIFTNFGTLYVD